MKVSFIADGFNLYHSFRDYQEKSNICVKWLDLKELCESYLSAIAQTANSKTILGEIYYFSAYASHLTANNPDVVKRHKRFIDALKDTGVICEMSSFKRKSIYCKPCEKNIYKYEEKETDVKIALKFLELFHQDKCDAIVLLSGDTDLIPAFETAKRLFPTKKLFVLFPYNRHNRDLERVADKCFKIKPKKYRENQLKSPHTCSDGSQIIKPSSW